MNNLTLHSLIHFMVQSQLPMEVHKLAESEELVEYLAQNPNAFFRTPLVGEVATAEIASKVLKATSVASQFTYIYQPHPEGYDKDESIEMSKDMFDKLQAFVRITIEEKLVTVYSIKDKSVIFKVSNVMELEKNNLSIPLQNTIMNGLSRADRDDFERFLSTYETQTRKGNNGVALMSEGDK